MGIERWEQPVDYEREAPERLVPHYDGDYVLYADHAEAVAGLVRVLERMVEQFTGSIQNLNDQDAIDEARAALAAHKP